MLYLRSFCAALAVAAMLAVGGCQTVDGLAGSSDFFAKAYETGGKVDDAVVGNFAKGVLLYCKIPGVGRKIAREHLNSRPEFFDESGKRKAAVAAWCGGEAPIALGP